MFFKKQRHIFTQFLSGFQWWGILGQSKVLPWEFNNVMVLSKQSQELSPNLSAFWDYDRLEESSV